MRLTNGDLCHVDDWVLFKSDASGAAVPALGHIKEIIAFLNPATANTVQLTHTFVLLQHMDIGTVCALRLTECHPYLLGTTG